SQLQGLTRDSDAPRRVDLCLSALALVDRTRQADLWAALHSTVGTSLGKSPLNSRVDNLERAIQHYNQALEVFSLHLYPVQWAETHSNLAGIYSERIVEARSANLEQAIQHCTHALHVFTQEAHPDQWASVQNTLANVYSNRVHGGTRNNHHL